MATDLGPVRATRRKEKKRKKGKKKKKKKKKKKNKKTSHVKRKKFDLNYFNECMLPVSLVLCTT